MKIEIIDSNTFYNYFVDAVYRWPAIVFFKRKFVVLYDNDGDENIRMVRLFDNMWGAWRHGGGIRFCGLEDDGVIYQRRSSYIDSWRPYTPFENMPKLILFREKPEVPPMVKYNGKEI